MIAQRFRSLGWVAGVATAATALYLVSLQVAAERAKLEDVERRIGAAQRDMVRLQTELSTRSSLRQLEKWNGETLSLSAPRAGQFLHDGQQLASLTTVQPKAGAGQPRAMLALVTSAPVVLEVPVTTPAAAIKPATPQPAAPQPAIVQPAITRPALKPIAPIASAPAHLERTAFVKAAAPIAPQRIAMAAKPLLARGTLGDMLRQAAQEGRKRP